MRAVADSYHERVLIGEIYLPIERLVSYYGANGNGVHLPFNFQLLTLPWNARQIDRAINDYEGALPRDGWPNWVLGNHDRPRIATRVGRAQARVAAVLLLTLRGTPTMYYADELGLCDVAIPEARMQDPQGLGHGPQFSRDPHRTPMPWDDSRNGAFTMATTCRWRPMATSSPTSVNTKRRAVWWRSTWVDGSSRWRSTSVKVPFCSAPMAIVTANASAAP